MVRIILTGGCQYTEDSFHTVHKTIDIECHELEKILTNDRTFKFVSGAEVIKDCPECNKIVPVKIEYSKKYKCPKCEHKWDIE